MMQWYIDIFFRFLNFSAIIALTWYAFVHFLAPAIQEEINHEQEKAMLQQQKQQLLEQNITELTQQSQQEHLFYETIKDRIIAWQAIAEEKEKNYQEKQHRLTQLLIDRSKTQQYNHTLLINRSREAESVVLAVLEGIKKKYSNMTTKEQLTTLVIESITTLENDNT
jgi:hypothetical protein